MSSHPPVLDRRRTRTALACTVVVALGAVGLPFAAGGSPDEGDVMVREARHAARGHDFSGTMSLQWYDGTDYHSGTMPVRSVDGVIEIEGKRTVVSDDGGGYVHDDSGWRTLWREGEAVDAPDPSAKYDLNVSTAVVGGRTTNLVEIHDGDGGALRERRFLDDDTGIVLRREQFDDDGRAVRVLTLNRIEEIADGPSAGPAAVPPDGVESVTAATTLGGADIDAPESVGDGWRLQAAEVVSSDTTQFHYSDGVFGLSVSETDGELDWDALPPAGDDADIAGHPVRLWHAPGGSVAVWEMDDTTFAVVTDGPVSDLPAVIDDFEGSDSFLGRLVRFAISPFSLF